MVGIRRAPTISYKSCPDYIKQYNRRWWIFGRDVEKKDGVYVLCIDRILNIETTGKHFKASGIDWPLYFKEIIGVTNKPEIKRSHIRFLAFGIGRFHILNNPLHGSQRHRYIGNNTYEFYLYVKINYELKKTLMQYAHEIKILEPLELV